MQAKSLTTWPSLLLPLNRTLLLLYTCIEVAFCSVYTCTEIAFCSIYTCTEVAFCFVYTCIEVAFCSVYTCIEVAFCSVYWSTCIELALYRNDAKTVSQWNAVLLGHAKGIMLSEWFTGYQVQNMRNKSTRKDPHCIFTTSIKPMVLYDVTRRWRAHDVITSYVTYQNGSLQYSTNWRSETI